MEPFVFNSAIESAPLIEHLHYLDNRDHRFSAEQILQGLADQDFNASNSFHLMLPVSNVRQAGDFWLQFAIDNQRQEDAILVIDYATTPSVSRIFILKPDGSQIVRTLTMDGDLPRTKRLVPLSKGSWKVMIEMFPDDFSLPLARLDIKTVNDLTGNAPELHFLSISYGICLALIAYNFILALTLRSRSHVIYICYSIAVLLYYEGRYQVLAEQFNFPELPKWSLLPINISSSFLFVVFLYDALGISKNMPVWKIPLRIIFALGPLLIAYSFVDRMAAQRLLLLFLIVFAPLGTFIGLHAVIKKVPGSRLLLVSTILPGLGIVIHFLPAVFSSWLPMPLIASAQILALDLEMILLSMTVGFKINREQEWMRRKIDHAYAELKTIVYPHQVEQIWDGKSLSQTMPLGMQNAFILVFDVVASSKMQLSDPRAFLSGIFRECSQLLMKNYQPEYLKANGYRIKEMGDGFICSVGFPFGNNSENQADHSIELAHEFVRIFEKHVEACGVGQTIQCAIGIAYGPVEAFYPESGAQVYDLFGRGIILAHRYESMRDIIFLRLRKKDNIIILHKPVFDQLSFTHQSTFVEVDLKSSDIKVRDDEEATQLFYQLSSGREQRKLLSGKLSA